MHLGTADTGPRQLGCCPRIFVQGLVLFPPLVISSLLTTWWAAFWRCSVGVSGYEYSVLHTSMLSSGCSRSELQRGCVSGCCCHCWAVDKLPSFGDGISAAGLSSSVLQFWFWLWRIQIFKEDLQELYKWHWEVLIDRHLNKLFQYSVEIMIWCLISKPPETASFI